MQGVQTSKTNYFTHFIGCKKQQRARCNFFQTTGTEKSDCSPSTSATGNPCTWPSQMAPIGLPG